MDLKRIARKCITLIPIQNLKEIIRVTLKRLLDKWDKSIENVDE